MNDFDDTACLPSPEQALRDATTGTPERLRPDNGNLLELLRTSRVLFYPGAFDDMSPALRFACSGGVDAVVYCDYSKRLDAYGFKGLLDEFAYARRDRGSIGRNGSHFFANRPDEMREVRAEELGYRCRADFMPVLRHRWGRRDDDATQAVIGWRADLCAVGDDDRRLVFLYLDTEGIQTFINVWALVGLAPQIVVVQDHGKGGLWTRFGGDSLLYAAAPRLSRFLYVGDIGTTPWPRYREISCKVVDDRSLHHSLRSLWECAQPDLVNPDSPLRVVIQGSHSPVARERAAEMKPFHLPEAVRTMAGIPAPAVGTPEKPS